jgi:hypothetical protein
VTINRFTIEWGTGWDTVGIYNTAMRDGKQREFTIGISTEPPCRTLLFIETIKIPKLINFSKVTCDQLISVQLFNALDINYNISSHMQRQ